jgi:transposase
VVGHRGPARGGAGPSHVGAGDHALLTTQIQALDRHIKTTVRRDATARRLQTIPGIGPFGALLLQAEIGPITRFGSAQELAAYAGFVPSTRSSGDKTAMGPWAVGIRG